MSDENKKYQLALFAFASMLTGPMILYFLTLQGIGISPDGADYLDAALHIFKGDGLHFSKPGGGLMPYFHYPPLFPVFLAGLHILFADIELGVLSMNAICLALSALILFKLLYRASKSSFLAFSGSIVFSLSLGVLTTFSFVQSEPPFILCLLLIWYRVKANLSSGEKLFSAFLLGILCAICMGLRYAGVFVTIWLIFNSLFNRKQLRRARAYHLVLLVSFLLACMLIFSSAGIANSNRVINLHLPQFADISSGLNVIVSWFAGSQMPGVLRLLIFVLLLAFATWGLLRLSLKDYLLELSFIVIYFFGILLSRSFADAILPFDYRILLPALPFAIYLVSLGLMALLKNKSRWMIHIVWLPALFLLMIDASLFLRNSANGLGANYVGVKQDLFISTLDSLGDSNPIYTNSPEILMYHLGKRPKRLPREIDKYAQLANKAYANEIAEWEKDRRNSNVCVVLYGKNQEKIKNKLPELVSSQLTLSELGARGALYTVKKD